MKLTALVLGLIFLNHNAEAMEICTALGIYQVIVADSTPSVQSLQQKEIDTVIADFKSKSILVKLKEHETYEYDIKSDAFNNTEALAATIREAYETISRVFTKAEQAPTFPGGEDAWKTYIRQFCKQHENELAGKIPYKVAVQFIVDHNGNIHEVELINEGNKKLSRLAMQAIIQSPRWIPAAQNGRSVVCYHKQVIEMLL